MTEHVGEAIVLRTWPFHEADLVVSLFTREQGRVKGVARHALKSRRRFGGALEPMTHVRASYAERPRQELVRLDALEILSSPMSRPVDYARTAALQLVAEVLEEALPEGAWRMRSSGWRWRCWTSCRWGGCGCRLHILRCG